MRWLLPLVLLAGCGSQSSPELVAEIGMPEVTAAWWEGMTVRVQANVAADDASDLCGRIFMKLDGPPGGVNLEFGGFPLGQGLVCHG